MDELTVRCWIRTCYATAEGQSAILSVFQPTNPDGERLFRLKGPAFEKALDFRLLSSPSDLWRVFLCVSGAFVCFLIPNKRLPSTAESSAVFKVSHLRPVQLEGFLCLLIL